MCSVTVELTHINTRNEGEDFDATVRIKSLKDSAGRVIKSGPE